LRNSDALRAVNRNGFHNSLGPISNEDEGFLLTRHRRAQYEFTGLLPVSRHCCARICARMTAFLLTIRDKSAIPQGWHFPLVKMLDFETKSDVLKSMISQS
jgi:hypothetical protein